LPFTQTFWAVSPHTYASTTPQKVWVAPATAGGRWWADRGRQWARDQTVSGGQLVLAALAMGLGATVQGTIGFGQALVATPLLLLIDTRLVPGPATVAGVVLSVLVVIRERSVIQVRGLRWAVLGLVPGTVLAAVALAHLSPTGLAALAAAMILAAVAASLGGVRVTPSVRALSVAGLISGFMGTTAAVSGPPMALVYQRESGPALRATLARFFLAASVLTVIALVPAGKVDRDAVQTGLVMVPGVLLGFACSGLLIGRVDRGLTRIAVLIVSSVSALAVLARVLL